ncbi:DUF4232 domain-containing protein [Streptomyces sp. NPDC091272]|uniref:DUF4232 domain-containing protein n=1 Tax=Streptomyces sp. NPDC091272 TaxID=3365981 RepID=UPI003800FDE8
MSVRTARRTRLFALSAVALATTLSLTACDNGEGTKDAGAAPTSALPATSPTSPTSAISPTPATSATSAPSAASAPSTASTASATKATRVRRARCDASTVTVTAQVVTRPLNTMILTATNKGQKLCDLYYAPVLRFEGAQSVPPTMEDTQPQAVVSLNPGESGYAAVKLSSPEGTPDPGYTAKSLSLGFYDAQHHNLDGFAPVALPAGGVHIDSSLRVSYWQSDLDAVSGL